MVIYDIDFLMFYSKIIFSANDDDDDDDDGVYGGDTDSGEDTEDELRK